MVFCGLNYISSGLLKETNAYSTAINALSFEVYTYLKGGMLLIS